MLGVSGFLFRCEMGDGVCKSGGGQVIKISSVFTVGYPRYYVSITQAMILPQGRSVYRLRRDDRWKVKDWLVRVLAVFSFEPTILGACKRQTSSSGNSNQDG